MKKVTVLLLVFCLVITGCNGTSKKINKIDESTSSKYENIEMGSPELLNIVEDGVLNELIATLDSDTYEVNSVNAIYISQEYLEELQYNSQENIYFGYKLSDITKNFEGKKYVFCLSDDNQTTVKEFEEYDNTYEQVLKNIAIGTGVILVSVTVSVATGGLGTPSAISTVFAVATKGGTAVALSSAAIGGTISATITGMETHDMKSALKAGLLSASEDFKWGAIVGSATAGFGQTIKLVKQTSNAEKITSLVVKNKRAGVAREEKVLKRLLKKYKTKNGYEVVREAIIRDAQGNPIIDSVTNQARRIDFVVTNGNKVVDSIEVTSRTASKVAQVAKEERIRKAGNVFIKNSKGSLIELPKDAVTRIVRLK